MQKILCEFEKYLSNEAAKERYERQMKSLEFLEASKEVKSYYQ